MADSLLSVTVLNKGGLSEIIRLCHSGRGRRGGLRKVAVLEGPPPALAQTVHSESVSNSNGDNAQPALDCVCPRRYKTDIMGILSGLPRRSGGLKKRTEISGRTSAPSCISHQLPSKYIDTAHKHQQ